MALIEHLEKLRHFHKITFYNSINEAAKATGLSQAGLSKSVAALEDELGVALFLRSREGLTLTKEGALLLDKAHIILKTAGEAESQIRSLHSTKTPLHFKVGMYDSIAVYFFEDLQRYLSTIYPEIHLDLVVDTSTQIVKLVESEVLDLAFGVCSSEQKLESSVCKILFQDHYSFFVSSTMGETNRSIPLIIHPTATDHEGKSIESHLHKLFRKRPLYKVMNFETIKALTRTGLGVGVLPTQVAKPLLIKKELVPAEIGSTSRIFGRHSIGCFCTKKMQATYPHFLKDIYRLSDSWSKT